MRNQMMRIELDVGTARWILTAASFVMACAVIALHVPGHVSMDTSIQLHEAHTGLSESWNPPFMSALLHWLGGGELATSATVLLQILLLYGGMLLIAAVLLRERVRMGTRTLPAWALLLSLAVIANPIVALYAGIVWKDVLFAGLLIGSCALALVVTTSQGLLRFGCAVAVLFLLAAALQTRQQGVFMAPVLLLLLLARQGWGRPVWRWIFVILGFCVSVLFLQQRVGETVRDSGTRSTSVGFRSIMIFDMMGILARTQLTAEELVVPISKVQLDAIRRVYQPSRIDYISNDPVAEGWAASMSPVVLQASWWALLKQNPVAWASHKTVAYATLLGLRGIEPTTPIHIGVDGNAKYLREVGLQERRGPRDLLVWRLASSMFAWPVWRHAFWLAVLVVSTLVLRRASLVPPLRRSAYCVIVAGSLFYASFVPTMISSDFRYLFGAIPLVGALILLLSLAPRHVEVAS